MAQLVVLINNKDIIPPNLCLACSYILCYSHICEVSDLFIVGDLVLLSSANTDDLVTGSLISQVISSQPMMKVTYYR